MALKGIGLRIAMAGAVMVGVVGCDENPVTPEPSPVVTHTVDATTEWGYVRLGETPTTVTVADHTTSTAWDLAFLRSGVRVNSGAGGPGDVAVYCICQNAGQTDADIQELTAESELADFMEVTADDIPAAALWVDDASTEGSLFSDAASVWYKYNLTGQHRIWPTFQVYLVRTGGEVYKVQLISYYGLDGSTARQITFRSSKL